MNDELLSELRSLRKEISFLRREIRKDVRDMVDDAIWKHLLSRNMTDFKIGVEKLSQDIKETDCE